MHSEKFKQHVTSLFLEGFTRVEFTRASIWSLSPFQGHIFITILLFIMVFSLFLLLELILVTS